MKEVWGGDVGQATVIQLDKPLRYIWWYSKPDQWNALQVSWNILAGSAHIPEVDKGGDNQVQCLLHLVDDVDEWHLSVIIKSVSILCGVKHFVVMPHMVNTLGDNGYPNLPNHFLQTDWSFQRP